MVSEPAHLFCGLQRLDTQQLEPRRTARLTEVLKFVHPDTSTIEDCFLGDLHERSVVGPLVGGSCMADCYHFRHSRSSY